MEKNLNLILTLLKEERGFDSSGYVPSLIERRVEQRIVSAKSKDYEEYLNYIKEHSEEIDLLIDALTINVSRFFRNTLTFEYLADRILPSIVFEKKKTKDGSLRVWSAGCAAGEEPYSVAILIYELFEKEKSDLSLHLFASDIDKKSLKTAKEGVYPFESIKNVKYRILKKYFRQEGKLFRLVPEIKKLVTFTFYDLLEKKSYVPPDSVFGGFDLVFCRNVLIYFTPKFQDLIFDKLYRSLVKNGYLVLGEAERPILKYRGHFREMNDFCHIYRKI